MQCKHNILISSVHQLAFQDYCPLLTVISFSHFPSIVLRVYVQFISYYQWKGPPVLRLLLFLVMWAFQFCISSAALGALVIFFYHFLTQHSISYTEQHLGQTTYFLKVSDSIPINFIIIITVGAASSSSDSSDEVSIWYFNNMLQVWC